MLRRRRARWPLFPGVLGPRQCLRRAGRPGVAAAVPAVGAVSTAVDRRFHGRV